MGAGHELIPAAWQCSTRLLRATQPSDVEVALHREKNMSAEIIQFIPRPNPDRDRKLAEEAAKILAPFVETEGFTDTAPCELIPYGGTGIDGMPWLPTDGPLSGYKDPA